MTEEPTEDCKVPRRDYKCNECGKHWVDEWGWCDTSTCPRCQSTDVEVTTEQQYEE